MAEELTEQSLMEAMIGIPREGLVVRVGSPVLVRRAAGILGSEEHVRLDPALGPDEWSLTFGDA